MSFPVFISTALIEMLIPTMMTNDKNGDKLPHDTE